MLTESGFTYTAGVVQRALQHWDELVAFTESITANHCIPDHKTINPEDLHCLRMDIERSLATLSSRQYEAVQQHLMLGRPLLDVAAELGVCESAIRQRIHTGLAHLVAALNFGSKRPANLEVKFSCI